LLYAAAITEHTVILSKEVIKKPLENFEKVLEYVRKYENERKTPNEKFIFDIRTDIKALYDIFTIAIYGFTYIPETEETKNLKA
jgi:hypothetical protein